MLVEGPFNFVLFCALGLGARVRLFLVAVIQCLVRTTRVNTVVFLLQLQNSFIVASHWPVDFLFPRISFDHFAGLLKFNYFVPSLATLFNE